MVTNGGGLIQAAKQQELPAKYNLTELGTFAVSVGRAVAMSGVYGDITEPMGMMIAMDSAQRGVSILKLRETYHFMFKQLAMKSEKMLTNFNLSGGKHRWLSRSGEACEIELDLDGVKSTFRLTWEEAKAEPFVWQSASKNDKLKEDDIVSILASGDPKEIAKRLKLKPKYATPRARMQMLSARVVSDAVRAVFPAACEGSYTPEEVADYSGQDDGEAGEVVDGDFRVVDEPATTNTVTATSAANASPTVASQVTTTATAESPTTTAEPTGRATKQQREEIERLFAALNLSPESRNAVIAKRGVGALIGLSAEQADELIKGCTAKLAAATQAAADNAGGQSAVSPAATTILNRGPCTQPQIEQAKSLLKELEQLKPGSVAKFKEKMRDSGKEQIKDLTVDDCSLLIVQLGKKALDAFFAASLEPVKFDGPPDGE
jgi:hypothetical protein